MQIESDFHLHPRLSQDSIAVGRFELCQLRMQNDSRYPWFILVPERNGITEIYQLDSAERQQVMSESCYLAEQLAICYRADKMNIAAIGNVVAQLHIHHVVRYQADPAWPAPVWGSAPAIAYTEQAIAEQIELVKRQLSALKAFN